MLVAFMKTKYGLELSENTVKNMMISMSTFESLLRPLGSAHIIFQKGKIHTLVPEDYILAIMSTPSIKRRYKVTVYIPTTWSQNVLSVSILNSKTNVKLNVLRSKILKFFNQCK